MAKMWLLFTLLTSLLGGILARELAIKDKEWIQYKIKYNKTYENATEDFMRYYLYQQSKDQVRLFQEEEAKLRTFTMGINHMSDWTVEELPTVMGHRLSESKLARFTPEANCDIFQFLGIPDDVIVPDEIDWRQFGRVTRVKDQGNCGSCWAFATTGLLEGQLPQRKLVELSEQNLLDCTGGSCAGYLMHKALNEIKEDGIMASRDYPYKKEKRGCKHNKDKIVLKVADYCVDSLSEEKLKQVVGYYGPVAIAVEKLDLRFMKYESGLYECPKGKGDKHAMLIVGYGTDPVDGDYWIVKNSFQKCWGEDGYVRFARNKDNSCNIGGHVVVAKIELALGQILKGDFLY